MFDAWSQFKVAKQLALSNPDKADSDTTFAVGAEKSYDSLECGKMDDVTVPVAPVCFLTPATP